MAKYSQHSYYYDAKIPVHTKVFRNGSPKMMGITKSVTRANAGDYYKSVNVLWLTGTRKGQVVRVPVSDLVPLDVIIKDLTETREKMIAAWAILEDEVQKCLSTKASPVSSPSSLPSTSDGKQKDGSAGTSNLIFGEIA